MNEIIYNLVADLIQDGGMNYVIVKIPQGGVGTRSIHTTVTKNGVVQTLPTGTAATYTCKGHNGAGASIEFYCSVSNNKIIIPIIESMCVSNGVGKYRVEINDTSGATPTLSTFTFNLSIQRDPLPPEEIMASDDYQTLKALIDRVEGATSNWLIGHGVPASSLGRDLDLYIDIDNSKVYKKTSGAWVYQGTLGNQIYFAYATDDQGTDFSLTYDGTQTYLGICEGQAQIQPLTPELYTWIMIAGGDNMRVSAYGGTDDHTVDRADNLKGVSRVAGIEIPANTSTDTTTVTVTNSVIHTDSIIENVMTSIFGLNPISETISEGVLTLVFPAMSTSATAIVDIRNYNPITIDEDGTDVTNLVIEYYGEEDNIDFSQMSV